MEENERELIRTRLTLLTKHTRCTPEFLIFFFERKILTFDEIQEIVAIKVDSVRASQFYMLIRTRTDAFAVLKEGLLKYNQTDALNVLEGREDLVSEPSLEEVYSRIASSTLEPGTASSRKRNISFDVVAPVVSFIGRTKELDQLHQMVLRSHGAERIAVVSQVTSVSGLGGIGKTQLAREYVRINGKEFDGNVLWMNAESKQSLYNSFRRCAEKKLRLQTKYESGQEISVEDLAEAVYNYFEGWKALFVLDNAEKGDWFKEFMPKSSPTAKLFILITSRDREWDRGMEVLQLDELTEDEAVKLIQQGLDIDGNDSVQMDDIKKLAQTLQCFPLALQQAIAYIYEQQITSDYTIKNYLDEFERKQQELLNYTEEDQVCDPIFTTTTATTWSITFDKIKNDLNSGKLASLILNVVAYLGADNIKRGIFYLIPSVYNNAQFVSVDKKQINEAVRLLVKYSMLNGKENQSILSVHRLVQSVTRNQLARDGFEDNILEIAIQLLQGSDENDFPAEHIGHVLIVWRHAFAHNPIIEGYARQVSRILWKMMEVGHCDEGVLFGNKALEKFKKVFGENHLKCLYIQRNVGLILKEQCYYDKAVTILQNVFSKANSLFGEDSEISLLTKEDIGNIMQGNGKYHEAHQILEEVVEKNKVIYGDNHANTLRAEENYGLALLGEGKLSEAEEIFQRLIEIYIQKEDKKSTNVLGLQGNLVTSYLKKGNIDKALEVQREVYEKLTPVWVENISLFANVVGNLGELLNLSGKFEEALKILEGNIDKIRKPFGSKNLHVLEIQGVIGRAYLGLGNFRKAHEILESAHQDLVSIYGEDSLHALFANKEVAITLSRLGEHSQALSKYREIIAKMELLFGKESYKMVVSKWDIALAIESSGENFPMALDLLLKVKTSMMPFVGEELTPRREAALTNDFVRILSKVIYLDNARSFLQDMLTKAKLLLGENSEFYLETMVMLGLTLIRKENFNEGKRIFEEALTLKEKLLGKNHISTLRCKVNYGVILMENGEWNEAEEIFQKISEICSQKEVEYDIDLWKLQGHLAFIYLSKQHHEKSLKIYKEVYEKLNPFWNEHVQFFSTICCGFGRSLNGIGKYKEALEILEENIEKIKDQLGSQHLNVLHILRHIGVAYGGLGSYKKAIEIFQNAHQSYVSLSEEGNLNALLLISDLGITLFCMGQHAEALSKFREVIPKLETTLGKENLDVVIIKWRFALAIERSGKNFPVALDILLNVKSSIISFVGKELSPKRESSLTNDFIRILNKIGDLDNAISILRDILPKAKLLLGENSEFYLETKEKLGNTLFHFEKFKEAEQILEEVLTKKVKLFGKNSLSTLRCQMNYGNALMEYGNLGEADETFQSILETCSQKDVEKDINVWELQNDLACLYFNKGYYGKSLEIIRKIYEMLCPVWNEEVKFFAVVCHNFGETLNSVGKHDDALKILEENIEKIKERLASQHAMTINIQQEIGYTYQCLGNFSKAHEILQNVYQAFVSLSGEWSLNALKILYNVAMSLFEMGEHAKAFSKFRKVFSKLETLLGKKDLGFIIKQRDFALAIARSGENLQTALDFLNRVRTSLSSIIGEDSEHVEIISTQINAIEKTIKGFEETTSTLQDLLPIAQSKYVENTEFFLKIKEKLGNTLIRNGKYAEAQIVLGELLEVREILLGEDHSSTLATRVSYGMALMEDGKLEEAQDIFQKISKFYLERSDENNKNMLRSQICLDLISIRKEVFDNKT